MKNLEKMEQNSKIFECASVCLGKIEKVSTTFCPYINSSSTILQQLSVNTQMLFTTVCYPVVYTAKERRKMGNYFLFNRLLGYKINVGFVEVGVGRTRITSTRDIRSY